MRSESLPPEDQHRLIQELAARAAKAASSEPQRSIMEFRGLEAEIWESIDAQDYVNRERASWDE
jgi:hypothetical protein